MILIDTGPLVALLDADDSQHQLCVAIARRLPATPLLTTWPCFTEAMYLLGAVGGYAYQTHLWQLWETQKLHLHEPTINELNRMIGLMAKYHDTPMDLADASLVAMAESRGLRSIFSLDSDFYIYRLLDGSVLNILR